MTLFHGIAVHARTWFAGNALAVWAVAAMACATYLPGPLWAQPQWITSGNTLLTSPNNATVSIGNSNNGTLLLNGSSNLGGGTTAGGTSNWLPWTDGNDYIQLTGTTSSFSITTPAGYAVKVNNGGQVGIGTGNPGQCGGANTQLCVLTVNGAIGTKEIVVTNANLAEYVFDPDYRLAPLQEVAAYIQENHHLPEIPSAAEAKEKGVSLGDMQAKLLAKIEELTLHLIQADEKNRELQERMARLEAGGR